MPWPSYSRLVAVALAFPTVVGADIAIAMNAIATPTPYAQISTPRPTTRPRRSPVTITFNPPRRGAPPATVGLGSRGDCLENRNDPLRVLIPTESPLMASGATTLSLTTDTYANFFVYVPAHAASAQGLSLQVMRVEGDREIELYRQTYALPSTAGVVQLRSPGSSLLALESGQPYHWYVSMVCGSVDQSGNPIVEGWLERVEPDAALATRLNQAVPLDKAVLYGQAGIWQNTVMTLAELRQTRPTDPVLQETWRDLLRSVGLGAIADAPLLDCCQPLRPASTAATP